jgi:hypothetical protein
VYLPIAIGITTCAFYFITPIKNEVFWHVYLPIAIGGANAIVCKINSD